MGRLPCSVHRALNVLCCIASVCGGLACGHRCPAQVTVAPGHWHVTIHEVADQPVPSNSTAVLLPSEPGDPCDGVGRSYGAILSQYGEPPTPFGDGDYVRFALVSPSRPPRSIKGSAVVRVERSGDVAKVVVTQRAFDSWMHPVGVALAAELELTPAQTAELFGCLSEQIEVAAEQYDASGDCYAVDARLQGKRTILAKPYPTKCMRIAYRAAGPARAALDSCR